MNLKESGCHANDGDAETLVDSVLAAQANLDQMATLTAQAPASDPATQERRAKASVGAGPRIEEVVGDKGYHKASTLEQAEDRGLRTYIAEPKRKGKRCWEDKPSSHQKAVGNNRRRLQRDKSKQLHRLRGERVERSFAHVCDTGGSRRSWLRGLEKVTKRYRIAAAAHNLALILRKLFGTGKPKGQQDAEEDATASVFALLHVLWVILGRLWSPFSLTNQSRRTFWRRRLPFRKFWHTGENTV